MALQLQVKKIIKKDIVKESVFFTPKALSGGIALCGKIGSGKTLAMFSLAQKYHDYRKYKIFDLWGGRRNQGENLYWILPSPYLSYWALVKKKLRLNNDGAKQYKCNLLFPLSPKMPNDLPYLESYVFSKPFTIPILNIEIEDFKMSMNNLSDDSKTLWENIKREIKKNDGIVELIKLFEKHKGMNNPLYKNFFHPLIEMGILASSVAETNIDIKKEAKNIEAISILVLHYIPDKYKTFIMNYFLRRLKELSDEGYIGTRNMALIREAYEFFRATERSVAENRTKEFRIKLTFYMQYARGKIHLVLDAQSPSETHGFFNVNQDMIVLGKLPTEDDRKYATDQFKRDGKMTGKQIMHLGELKAGRYYIMESGKSAKERYFLLPRTSFWREGDGNFYKIWGKIKGDNAFKNFKGLKEEIIGGYKEKLRQINTEEKDKKTKIRIEKAEKERTEKAEKEKVGLEGYERELREKEKIRKKLKEEKKEEKAEKIIGNNKEEVKDIKKEAESEDSHLNKMFMGMKNGRT